MEPKLISLNIGKPKKLKTEENEFVSGVGKQSVDRAFLTKEGFIDDGVQQTKFHGGPDRAVLFYCFDHYQQWEGEFGKPLMVPGFGENITVSGLSEADVHIGDVYQIGEAIVEITQSRIPCNTLSKYNDENSLLSRLVSTGFTGYLGRVLQEGWIEQDSTITRTKRNPNSVSVLFSNQIYFHDKNNLDGMERLLQIEELASAWRKKIEQRVNKLK
ncbi:MOSC domain-containing protein [Bacillus mesophilus]|uniref:MOSC domain-containing protein n=1 Tax=Bacillus mesophilus TaxID=1808955 RepID=A0A6M0Q607_9BACI|nr:MOSC domain-containing protein [Bacillus mesophilus]